MNANQWLISVGVPSLFVIVFLVWEWRSKRRVRHEGQSSLTFDVPINFRPRISLSLRSTSPVSTRRMSRRS